MRLLVALAVLITATPAFAQKTAVGSFFEFWKVLGWGPNWVAILTLVYVLLGLKPKNLILSTIIGLIGSVVLYRLSLCFWGFAIGIFALDALIYVVKGYHRELLGGSGGGGDRRPTSFCPQCRADTEGRNFCLKCGSAKSGSQPSQATTRPDVHRGALSSSHSEDEYDIPTN